MDLYQPCPGGLPKKIKFCCRDLAAELGKLSRMIEGDQRHAATDTVERLLAKHPDRQCLWAIKTTLFLQSDQPEKAKDSLARFRALAPENPIALAMSAMSLGLQEPAGEGESPEHVEPDAAERVTDEMSALIQQALSACPEYLPMQLYEAISLLSQRLVTEGRFLSAIQHLSLLAIVADEDDSEPIEQLSAVQLSPDVPLLLKRGPALPPTEEGASWKPDYDRALELESIGCWAAAAAEIDKLVADHPDAITLLRAAAALHARLPNRQPCVAALRRVATAAEATADEAVEAEAMAQLIDEDAEVSMSDQLRVKWTLAHAETALERLQSDPRCLSAGGELPQLQTQDQPPPKAVFTILDRPLPTSPDGLTEETLPRALSMALLFGKETNQEARLEFMVNRGHDEQEVTRMLQEILGDNGRPDGEPSVTGQISRARLALSQSPVFPQDTPIPKRLELAAQLRRHVLLKVFPDTPSDVLGGKTPRDAATDSHLRIPLEAQVLNMEVADRSPLGPQDFQALREELGLPIPPPIPPQGNDVARIPLPRLTRLELGGLDDEALSMAFVRADRCRFFAAIMRLGEELLRRETMQGQFKPSAVHMSMAAATSDNEFALECVQRAENDMLNRRERIGTLLVSQLNLRLQRGDLAEAQRLLERIRDQHMKEPGVSDLLVSVMARYGLVRQGARTQAPTATPSSQPAQTPPDAGGQIWTPDGGAPPPAEPQKSKLWVPGAD